MKTVDFVFLVISSLALRPGLSPATTYYVDQNHALANDSNAGTEALPWITVQRAGDVLVAGDMVRVKAGIYNESLRPANDGLAGQPIIYQAYGDGHTILDGTGIGVPEYQGLVHLQNRSHITIDGFTVQNVGPLGTNSGIQVNESNAIQIINNHTINTASSGIQSWGSSEILIDSNEVEGAAAAGVDGQNECITAGETTGFQISNNHVHHGSTVRGEGTPAIAMVDESGRPVRLEGGGGAGSLGAYEALIAMLLLLPTLAGRCRRRPRA